MNDLFRALPSVENAHDHKKHLRQVLKILKNNQVHAKRSKCSFFESLVKYLGHVISDGTLTVDPAEVDAILKWPDVHDM